VVVVVVFGVGCCCHVVVDVVVDVDMVGVVVDQMERGSNFGLFWVTRPLLSHISTYRSILDRILAWMSQQLSAYFIVTAEGLVFESAKRQIFFCTT
jgi:hypothetical protein